MALTLATSITMNSGSYWSAGSASQTIPSSATSDNVTPGYNASHAASNPSGLYGGLPNSQMPYNGLSSRGQTQGQAVHRPSATSSSSLQYALRPQAQHASLASLQSVTNMSSISAGSTASLSPLSPLTPSQIDGGAGAGAGMSATSPDGAVYRYRYPPSQSQHHDAQSENRTYVHSPWYQAQTQAANTLSNALGSTYNKFGNGNANSGGSENFNANSNARLYTFDSPPGPFDQEDELGSTPVLLNSAGVNAGSRSPGSGSGMGSPDPGRTHYHSTQSIPAVQAAYTRLSSAHTHARHGTEDAQERHYFRTSDGGSSSGGVTQPCVKTEPDLEEHSHPAHPAGAGEEGEGGGGGTRFVMEHPYPYSYASSKSDRGREDERERSFSLTPDTPVSPVHSFSAGTQSQPTIPFSSFQQQQQQQPHSLTAPLRAANATAAMRACMGVFRLDPFAQLNGVALRCGFVTDPSSFSDFSGKGRDKTKTKAKAKRKTKAAKKRKRRGSEAASPDDESEDDLDDEDSVDDAPTWDGGQAGPLKEEPMMIEFQLYFEGMVVEGSDTELDAADGDVAARLTRCGAEIDSDEGKDVLDGDDHLYSGGRGGQSGPRRLRLVEDVFGRRYSSDPYDEGDAHQREYGYGGEHQPEQLKTDSMASRLRPSSPNFEDYLDFDMDMDGRGGWASADAELSPTPSYLLMNNNANAHAHALTQAQAQTRMQTSGSGSTTTRTPALTDSSNSSSSTNSYSFMSTSSSSAFTSDYNRPPVGGMRYIDSSGYIRVQPDVGTNVHSNTNDGQQSGQAISSTVNVQSGHTQSLYANLTGARGAGSVNGMNPAGTNAGVGSGGTSATLQQLRTQAALRAVQQHQQNQTQGRVHNTQSPQAYNRSALDSSGVLQRSPGAVAAAVGGGGAGTGTTARFTPTPASIVAEMQTGLLVSGRAHQHHQQQNRAHATSLVGHSQSSHGQGQGQSLTGPGVGTGSAGSSPASYTQQQQVASGTVSRCQYPGDVYPDYSQGTGRGTASATLAGAFSIDGSLEVGHGHGSEYGLIGRTDTSGTEAGSGLGGTSAVTHNGHEGANVHALERRWGDGLQRVHA